MKHTNHGCLWALAIIGAVVAVAIIGFFVLIGVAANNVHTDPQVNKDGVSRGFGTQDAAADVTGARLVMSANGQPQVEVTVTNHSSKRSNYSITVSIESADGATKYAQASLLFNKIAPNQSATSTTYVLDFVGPRSQGIPAGAVAKAITVSRTASL